MVPAKLHDVRLAHSLVYGNASTRRSNQNRSVVRTGPSRPAPTTFLSGILTSGSETGRAHRSSSAALSHELPVHHSTLIAGGTAELVVIHFADLNLVALIERLVTFRLFGAGGRFAQVSRSDG